MIDIRTFMLVLALGNLGFALLMAGYARGPSSHPAMHVWAWARLLRGAAHLLVWSRPDVGGVWTAAGGYTLLIVGMATEVAAYCLFLDLARWRWRLLWSTLLALVLVVAASAAQLPPMQLLRVVLGAAAAFSLAMAALLLRDWTGASLLRRLIGLNNVLFAAALGARAVHGMTVTHLHLVSADGLLSATIAICYFMMIVNGSGFLLLCKEKDDARMVQLASYDFLTGLVNRHAFLERTASARALAARQRTPIALMMIDIDHFKKINDCYGHAMGDEALALFAARAKATLRDHDILGRLGGEEFALLLPATDLAGALLAAERLRSTVAASVLTSDSGDYAMTISVGVVVVEDYEHINAALARADRALYAAKTGGRNRISVGRNMQAAEEMA